MHLFRCQAADFPFGAFSLPLLANLNLLGCHFIPDKHWLGCESRLQRSFRSSLLSLDHVDNPSSPTLLTLSTDFFPWLSGHGVVAPNTKHNKQPQKHLKKLPRKPKMTNFCSLSTAIHSLRPSFQSHFGFPAVPLSRYARDTGTILLLRFNPSHYEMTRTAPLHQKAAHPLPPKKRRPYISQFPSVQLHRRTETKRRPMNCTWLPPNDLTEKRKRGVWFSSKICQRALFCLKSFLHPSLISIDMYPPCEDSLSSTPPSRSFDLTCPIFLV